MPLLPEISTPPCFQNTSASTIPVPLDPKKGFFYKSYSEQDFVKNAKFLYDLVISSRSLGPNSHLFPQEGDFKMTHAEGLVTSLPLSYFELLSDPTFDVSAAAEDQLESLVIGDDANAIYASNNFGEEEMSLSK